MWNQPAKALTILELHGHVGGFSNVTRTQEIL